MRAPRSLLAGFAIIVLLPLGLRAADAPSSALALAARGEEKRFAEDWYGAIDDFMAALRQNPSFGDALVGLARCYYELGEYEQALSYAMKGEALRKGDLSLVDLEAFIRLGQGDLAAARKRFESVLASLPNDLDARFGLGLIDLAGGRKTEAKARFQDSLRVAPLDARSLCSLALISLDQGRAEEASLIIGKALDAHAEDPRVQAVAARVSAAQGLGDDAVFHARNAVRLHPGRAEYRSLLGSLLYTAGDFAAAAEVMREAIARDRKDQGAWFTLGLAQAAQDKPQDAIFSLKTASDLKPDDEVARMALESLIADTTRLESPDRQPYSDWHVAKGRELEERSYFDQALVEYRRALRIWPYSAQGRIRYAELLRKRGFPARQLSELRFLEALGKADRGTLDSIEIYASLLADSVGLSWGFDQFSLEKRPYRIAVFVLPSRSLEYHTDSAVILRRYLVDMLASSSRLRTLALPPSVASPGEAFKLARESDADYYLIFSAQETDREIQLSGELRVGRTGSLATTFRAYRTGNDRVKNTVLRLADSLIASLQPKGSILKRSQDSALIDLGLADGLKAGDRLVILKKGSLDVRNEGLGPSWLAQSELGVFTVKALDEEVSSGILKSSGFFDTINLGDEVIAVPEEAAKQPAAPASEPELPLLFETVRKLR